jgi:hypothetical protein
MIVKMIGLSLERMLLVSAEITRFNFYLTTSKVLVV